VVAYLALFVALGGSALAVSHLGKNSVGSKQLKKNAVTETKIKNEAVTAAKVKKGTLTGAQIDASTLGTVPAATRAGDATTLSGSPNSDFARASRFLFGHGKVNATTDETLIAVPGDFVLSTNGLGKFEPKLAVDDTSQDQWDFLDKTNENVWGGVSTAPGERAEIDFRGAEAGILYAVDRSRPGRQVVITCTVEFLISELACAAILSPSA
jgi:hypothetical protein